jgi:predicted kinase
MPTIHMIHGFVGAGKTTFSKKLEKEVQAVRFTPDEWMVELYGQNPPAEKFAEYDKNIKSIIWNTAEKILVNGGNVIFDFGFWRWSEREDVRKRAKKLFVDVKLYNLQCPEEIMKQRVLARTAEMPDGALFIDENAINEFKKYLEPVDPKTEDCLLIKTY